MGNTNSEYIECINENHIIRSKLDKSYPTSEFEKLNQELEKLEDEHDFSYRTFCPENTEKAKRISNLITDKKQKIWNMKVSLNKEFC